MARAIDRFPVCIEPSEIRTGRDVLKAILDLGSAVIRDLQPGDAMSGRLRGTGPGVSFTELLRTLESDHPVQLAAPFEKSDRVAGAAWRASELLDQKDDRGLVKLHWSAGTADIPLHVHKHSDRFIIVLQGRGFFHVDPELAASSSRWTMGTIAAREMDFFAFTRGVVHTFTTDKYPMTLLSVHTPFLSLDATDQWVPAPPRSNDVRYGSSPLVITACGTARLSEM